MSDEGHGEFALVLPFDSDDPEFVRGAEVGMVFVKLAQGERGPFEVHDENAEMLIRLAEARGLRCVAEPIGYGWLRARFEE